MIIQENEFLKTYNDMSRLWEEAESTRSRRPTFPFEEVVEKAFTAIKKITTLTPEDINYWRDLDYLLSHKFCRYGGKSWVDRFITFYKAYKVESAILNWLETNGNTYGISNPSFAAGDTHHNLEPDTTSNSRNKPDLAITVQGEKYTIECKTLSVDAATHGADLIARHTAVDISKNEESVYFCLVGIPQSTPRKKSVTDIFGEDTVQKLKNAELLYIIDPNLRDLSTGFKKSLPTAGQPITINFPENLVWTLQQIAEAIVTKNDVAKVDKAAHIIDQQTATINSTIEKQFKSVPPKVEDNPEDPLNTAISNLKASTNKLIDTAKATVGAKSSKQA
jgi:hypothetical protein